MYVWRCSEEVRYFGCCVEFMKVKEADCNSEAVLTVEQVQRHKLDLRQTRPLLSSLFLSFSSPLGSLVLPEAFQGLLQRLERWQSIRACFGKDEMVLSLTVIRASQITDVWRAACRPRPPRLLFTLLHLCRGKSLLCVSGPSRLTVQFRNSINSEVIC